MKSDKEILDDVRAVMKEWENHPDDEPVEHLWAAINYALDGKGQNGFDVVHERPSPISPSSGGDSRIR